jgi:hypothetical protein
MIQYSHIVQTALNKRSIDADAEEKHEPIHQMMRLFYSLTENIEVIYIQQQLC